MEVLVIALVACVVGGPLLVVSWLRRVRTQVYGEALVQAGGDVLIEDSFANNFGIASWGKTQLRGNGTLILSTRALSFVQISPRRSLKVPLDAIRSVERTRSHLGKTTPATLVRVHFDNNGIEDSVAFAVAEPDRWMAELERVVEAQATAADVAARTSEAADRASSSAAARRPAARE